MKVATITLRVVYADDVTEDMIDTIAGNAFVQVVEPVVDLDESGNEIELAFDAYQAVDYHVSLGEFDDSSGARTPFDVASVLRGI